MEQITLVNAKAGEVYRYMNFDQVPESVERAVCKGQVLPGNFWDLVVFFVFCAYHAQRRLHDETNVSDIVHQTAGESVAH